MWAGLLPLTVPGCRGGSVPSCASGSFFTLRFSPQLAGCLWELGSTWLSVPGTGLTPALLCPCSNGILYQYPDRTDVTPLLSVNMG